MFAHCTVSKRERERERERERKRGGGVMNIHTEGRTVREFDISGRSSRLSQSKQLSIYAVWILVVPPAH